jgi:acyl-CoA thioester hydrolase
VTRPFCYYLRVRYGDCDAQRIVFNPRYGEYIDLACFEFLRAALPRPQDAFDGNFEVKTVRQTLEWRASASFDDVLAISVCVRTLGTSSFTLGFEFRRAGEAALLATAETVYVHVDGTSFAKRTIEPAMRAALSAGASGKCVDHAGWLGPHEGAALD